MQLAKRFSWIVLFLMVGVFSRLLQLPPNFSAFIAIALFSGLVLPAPLAMLVAVGTVFAGDVLLGFHDLMWVVYLSLLPMVFVGSVLPKISSVKSGATWALAGLLSSVFFFLTTNFAVWWSSGMYPHTSAGLSECFVLALPFFHNSVVATWLFLGAFEGVRRLMPAPVAVRA